MRQCECGHLIPADAPNRQKYCPPCATDAIKKAQQKYYMRIHAGERKRRAEAGIPMRLDNDYYDQSLVDIGTFFGFTSERARQICSKAMNKFKKRYALMYGEYR